MGLQRVKKERAAEMGENYKTKLEMESKIVGGGGH